MQNVEFVSLHHWLDTISSSPLCMITPDARTSVQSFCCTAEEKTEQEDQRSKTNIVIRIPSKRIHFSSGPGGGLRCLKTPQATEGVLEPPVSVANITVKDNVHIGLHQN